MGLAGEEVRSGCEDAEVLEAEQIEHVSVLCEDGRLVGEGLVRQGLVGSGGEETGGEIGVGRRRGGEKVVLGDVAGR